METWSLVVAILCAQMAGAVGAKSETDEPKAVPLHQHPTLVRMLEENNRLRASVGLSPQTISPELTAAAQDHAWYMARTRSFSHHSNGGPSGRAARHAYRGPVAENIAMGHSTVSSVFQGWRASGGHWANITRRNNLAGFGYGISPSGEKYWVAMYGN